MHLFAHNFDHDYYFELLREGGAGCPINYSMFYCTPSPRSRTNGRARQGFNGKKTELPQQLSEQQSPDQNLGWNLRLPPPVPGRLQVLL